MVFASSDQKTHWTYATAPRTHIGHTGQLLWPNQICS